MTENNSWKVEEIETIDFDENGKENGTWKGYGVTSIEDPANYCFMCKDKTNAEELYEFLEKNGLTNDSILSISLRDFGRYVALKSETNKKLTSKIFELNNLKFNLETSKSKILLETNWSEIITGRVNNDLKDAYIQQECNETLNQINTLESEVTTLKREIDVLNDYISLEKYTIRMILE